MRVCDTLWGFVAMFAVGSVSCSSGQAGDEVFRIPVTVQAANGDVVFQAEIADTQEERARGLMFRESMKNEHGMLFLFPAAQQNSFWMKNTYIPLDIIFIRADRTVLGIAENAEPRTTTGRSVPGASQFVLEINGGLSAALGVRGDQDVRFMAPIPVAERSGLSPKTASKFAVASGGLR